jgi:hypothetical protein
VVISFGGGSPHDAAKAIAIVSSNGGRIHDYEGKLAALASRALTRAAQPGPGLRAAPYKLPLCSLPDPHVCIAPASPCGSAASRGFPARPADLPPPPPPLVQVSTRWPSPCCPWWPSTPRPALPRSSLASASSPTRRATSRCAARPGPGQQAGRQELGPARSAAPAAAPQWCSLIALRSQSAKTPPPPLAQPRTQHQDPPLLHAHSFLAPLACLP